MAVKWTQNIIVAVTTNAIILLKDTMTINDIAAALGIALLAVSSAAVGYVYGYRTADRVEPFEQITEQQYREQSLQYLEDIRNAQRDLFNNF